MRAQFPDRWQLVLILGVLGCSPSPRGSASPSAVEPDERAAAPATATMQASSTQQDDSRSPPTAPESEHDINARYREQTNPEVWKARFERPGREVYDHRDEIIRVLGLKPGIAIADIGAGTGLYTLEFARKVGPTGLVYAVDLQAYFLDHIAQKANKAKITNITLVRATEDASKLESGSIDIAFMCDAYHHIDNPAPYLKTVMDALRPGGRLVVVDYRRRDDSEGWIHEHIRADPEQFRAEIEAAGFIFQHELDLLQDNFFFEFTRP